MRLRILIMIVAVFTGFQLIQAQVPNILVRGELAQIGATSDLKADEICGEYFAQSKSQIRFGINSHSSTIPLSPSKDKLRIIIDASKLRPYVEVEVDRSINATDEMSDTSREAILKSLQPKEIVGVSIKLNPTDYDKAKACLPTP